MGDLPALKRAIFFGFISAKTTLFLSDNRTAFDNPTYQAPMTVIFIYWIAY